MISTKGRGTVLIDIINLENLILPGLGACFLLMLILIVLQILQRKRTISALNGIKEQLVRSAQELEERTSLRQREELTYNLHQLNDSLTSTFGQLNRSQTEQVNAVIRQSFENAQAFEHRQQTMQQMVDENMRRQELRMEALRKSMDESMRLLREENEKKLSEMRATVDEKLNETLEKRLSSSFSQVSERLEQVYRSLGEMRSLANGVGDLKRMLGNVKTRGVWGEVQLGALLEQALTESQYDTNVAVVPDSAERVEFAVRLPGRDKDSKPVYLPIDSKFPQEDYARLAEASQTGNQQAVEEAQKSLLNAVKTEAKRIGKYIAPPHTTDFAIMFLPLEGLYAEIVKHTGIVEMLQRDYRILVSGPSTLLALLNSLQMGFRTLAIEQRSAEVWKLLGAVKSDFGSFATLLQKTQEKLQQATNSIDSAFVKTRSIEKRLRSVESIGEQEAQKLLSDESKDGEQHNDLFH